MQESIVTLLQIIQLFIESFSLTICLITLIKNINNKYLKNINNKMLGRARDPRANGAWPNKLTE